MMYNINAGTKKFGAWEMWSHHTRHTDEVCPHFTVARTFYLL